MTRYELNQTAMTLALAVLRVCDRLHVEYVGDVHVTGICREVVDYINGIPTARGRITERDIEWLRNNKRDLLALELEQMRAAV